MNILRRKTLYIACLFIHILAARAEGVATLNDCNSFFQNRLFVAAKDCLDGLIARSTSKTEIEKARFLRANVNLELNEPILALHDLHDVPMDNQNAILFKARLHILIGNFKMAKEVIGTGSDAEAKKVLFAHNHLMQLLKTIANLQRQSDELLSRKESSSPELIIKLSGEILAESKYNVDILMLRANALIKSGRFTDALLTLQYG